MGKTKDVIYMEDILEKYKKLYSGVIYDAIKFDCKYNKPISINLKPLDNYNEPLVGRSFTCKGSDIKNQMHDDIRIEMYKSFKPNRIQVISSNSIWDVAKFGDVSASLTKKFGGKGCIIDGYTRDCKFIKDMNFKVYCKGCVPNSAYKYWEIIDFQCDIYLKGVIGKVKISPDDIIFADDDGVLVIPKKIEKKVLNFATIRMKKEQEVRDSLKSMSISDIIKKKNEDILW
jgi:regulator of RNase E activity RraA